MNKRQFNELKKEWLGVELDLEGVNYTVDRITNRGELGVVDEDGNQMIIEVADVYFLDDEEDYDEESVDSSSAPFPAPPIEEDPFVDNEDEGDITPPKKKKKTSKTD